ncbi:MAG: DUF4230 domain-containing protein [Erysipelotrichaceae bacterium]|nr:DUF4230 domain-containing protein [Erysipelotrichaceae bacterium]
MKKLKYIVAGLICAVALFAAGMLYAGQRQEPKITSNLIESTLIQSTDLITTKYHYSRVGKYDNSLELNGWTVPLTNKNFILQFQGEIQAGIDVKDVQIKIDGKEIRVNLPEVKVLNHVLDENSIQVYDEANNLFNPIRVDDYKTFAVQQKKVALKEAKDKGLMEEAEKQAKSVIKELITMLPQSEGYTITIQ